jgi:hypothetical protein
VPKGPRGERRPADMIGTAVMVGRLSVGDLQENLTQPSGKSRSGKAGARARSEQLTPERRKEIARVAALSRWK